ncbi:MAG: hypothetical protein XU15_C0011G0114 [candidate division NC10 bacterium CSP1-5]|nr:MAG: hypothetical protein XU15_C0011G0114 [candidate division NC10 bacterium CSP1-5]
MLQINHVEIRTIEAAKLMDFVGKAQPSAWGIGRYALQAGQPTIQVEQRVCHAAALELRQLAAEKDIANPALFAIAAYLGNL